MILIFVFCYVLVYESLITHIIVVNSWNAIPCFLVDAALISLQHTDLCPQAHSLPVFYPGRVCPGTGFRFILKFDVVLLTVTGNLAGGGRPH